MALTRPKYSQIYDSDFKNSCRVATASSITLTGGAPSTVDDVNLQAGDRILVKGQGLSSENGIYQVQTLGTGANGTWVRTQDASDGLRLSSGTTLSIAEGTSFAGKMYRMTTPDPINLGVSVITWADASGGGGAASGLNGQMQYNYLNGFGGAPFFYYNNSTGQVTANAGIGSTSTSTGTMIVTGGVGITGSVYQGGALSVAAPTPSTSTSTGALVVGGGAGIGAALNVAGITTISNSTASISTTTGALVVGGGVGVAGDMWVGGTLTVANLQARGSSQITVQDPMLYLQANVLYPWTYDTGVFSDSIGGPANTYVHHGIVRSTVSGTWGFFSNVKSEPDSAVNWADAGLVWDKVKAGELTLANTTSSTSTSTGALVVGGGAGIGGAVYIGSTLQVTANATLASVSISGDVTRNNKPLITNYSGTTPPSSPKQGDEWYYTTNDILYKYLYDGVGYSWVDLTSPLYNANVSAIANTLALRDGSGNLTATNFNGVASSAKYADLAEIYVSDTEYVPGTVVVFGGTAEITTTTITHDTRVAGVISTNPAYLMNSETPGLPVAFTGRVPCQVRGPIKKGDLVVTSTIPGVAQRIDNSLYNPGCVIGKALGQVEINEISTIEVVVGRF